MEMETCTWKQEQSISMKKRSKEQFCAHWAHSIIGLWALSLYQGPLHNSHLGTCCYGKAIWLGTVQSGTTAQGDSGEAKAQFRQSKLGDREEGKHAFTSALFQIAFQTWRRWLPLFLICFGTRSPLLQMCSVCLPWAARHTLLVFGGMLLGTLV